MIFKVLILTYLIINIKNKYFNYKSLFSLILLNYLAHLNIIAHDTTIISLLQTYYFVLLFKKKKTIILSYKTQLFAIALIITNYSPALKN